MKTHDLRTMKPAELTSRLSDLRAEYFSLKESIRLGKERNHARLPRLRRDIARTISVLREEQL